MKATIKTIIRYFYSGNCKRLCLSRLLLSLAIIPFSIGASIAQENQGEFLRGIILDREGNSIEGARITILKQSQEISGCESNRQGRFACKIDFAGEFVLSVEADGYSILRRNYPSRQGFLDNPKLTLRPDSIRENVVVTTSQIETRLSETPASVVTISKKQLLETASPAIDDALRQTAGFSLFRRSNSRNANPTTQGTSLRGINASGASRSLVLADGVPLNDSFGGWVGWSKIPRIAVERIEVLRGGASSLYGSSSLGGAIIIVRRKPSKENATVSAEVFGGTQNTASGSIFVGFKKNDWTFDVDASSFQTKGYRIVDESARGLIDDFANSHNAKFSGRVRKYFSNQSEVFFGASYFGDARNNGTPVQKNRTHSRQFLVGADFDLSNLSISNSRLSFRAYGGTQVFDQKFSAVASDRNGENLVRLQRVPSQNAGVVGKFSTVFKNHAILVGAEVREVRGSSNEIGYFGGGATSRLGTGGRKRNYAIYFQDFAKIGKKLVLVGNLRFDSWKNFRALQTSFRFSSGNFDTKVFPTETQNVISPAGAILYQVTDRASVYFNASRSFRAPTLNEMYRGFRVGSVITNPNEELTPEKALNIEGGVSYSAKNSYARVNIYRAEVSDAVSNVTVSTTPTLIFRQRQNAGKILVNGVELEAETRYRELGLSVGYLLADAKFAWFPANPQIEGLMIPQVPRHQFVFQARYAGAKGFGFSLQGRGASVQFDNDLNTLRLEPYFQLDVFISKKFSERWQAFVGIENLFNSRYSIGKTPVRTVNSPINIRLGLRWN